MRNGITLYAQKLFKNNKLPLNRQVTVRFGKQVYNIVYINQKVKDIDFNEQYVVNRIQISRPNLVGFGVLFKKDTWLNDRLHSSIKIL